MKCPVMYESNGKTLSGGGQGGISENTGGFGTSLENQEEF